MAAYCRVYDSRHLQADCQEPASAPEPYALKSSMGYLFTILQQCDATPPSPLGELTALPRPPGWILGEERNGKMERNGKGWKGEGKGKKGKGKMRRGK